MPAVKLTAEEAVYFAQEAAKTAAAMLESRDDPDAVRRSYAEGTPWVELIRELQEELEVTRLDELRQKAMALLPLAVEDLDMARRGLGRDSRRHTRDVGERRRSAFRGSAGGEAERVPGGGGDHSRRAHKDRGRRFGGYDVTVRILTTPTPCGRFDDAATFTRAASSFPSAVFG
jgi:hypothetical protein